jgi:hypothetical protein
MAALEVIALDTATPQLRAPGVGDTYTFPRSVAVTGSITFDGDAILQRDAANVLAQRNGTNAQSFRVYKTYTDASNYERASLYWNGTRLTLTPEAAGTGTLRSLEFNGSKVTCASAIFHFDTGGGGYQTATVNANSGNITICSTGLLSWSASANAIGYTGDVALARSAAGVLKVTNGSSGAGVIQTPALTVATLPAATTAGAGARSFVTDANATTFLSTVAGGGANKVPVVSDGTNWLIG